MGYCGRLLIPENRVRRRTPCQMPHGLTIRIRSAINTFTHRPNSIDPLSSADLHFSNNYALEDGFDGGVLEISVDARTIPRHSCSWRLLCAGRLQWHDQHLLRQSIGWSPGVDGQFGWFHRYRCRSRLVSADIALSCDGGWAAIAALPVKAGESMMSR